MRIFALMGHQRGVPLEFPLNLFAVPFTLDLGDQQRQELIDRIVPLAVFARGHQLPDDLPARRLQIFRSPPLLQPIDDTVDLAEVPAHRTHQPPRSAADLQSASRCNGNVLRQPLQLAFEVANDVGGRREKLVPSLSG